MQADAHYPEQTVASVASSGVDAERHPVGHFLYQGATVVAILVFLISFWSC
jgi:hypothetical protein